MSIKTIKLYDAEENFLVDVTPDGEGNFSHALDQGFGQKGVQAKAVDDAGNMSGFSSIKRYYPGCTNTPTVSLVDDTGAEGDNITNDPSPRVKASLTLPIPTGAGSVNSQSVKSLFLQYKEGAAGEWQDVGEFSSLTPVGNDTFEYTYQPAAFTPGDVYFRAKWIDVNDNESAYGTELHIIIDTSAPNPPTISLSDGMVYVGNTVTISGTSSDT